MNLNKVKKDISCPLVDKNCPVRGNKTVQLLMCKPVIDQKL